MTQKLKKNNLLNQNSMKSIIVNQILQTGQEAMALSSFQSPIFHGPNCSYGKVVKTDTDVSISKEGESSTQSI